MFERFTDRARRVVVLAQEEARLLWHNYIGTEHVLLGLIHEGEGVAAKALDSLNIELDAVRSEIEATIGRGQYQPAGHIPFTPRSKKVMELALKEALQLGHNYIGKEHILLAIIREGEGVAAKILIKLGADLNTARSAVIKTLTLPTIKPSPAPSTTYTPLPTNAPKHLPNGKLDGILTSDGNISLGVKIDLGGVEYMIAVPLTKFQRDYLVEKLTAKVLTPEEQHQEILKRQADQQL